MKDLRILLLISILLLSFNKIFAQDETDALRFSFLSPQGTARSIGFGSTLGSVGGDFTSLSVNPAGIGVYRKSEFMVTPSLMLNGVTTTYAGGKSNDFGGRFGLSNIGVVLTKAEKGQGYKASDWKASSFGLGINRLADFSRDYSYSGINYQNSASWVFEFDANNGGDVTAEGTPAWLGFQSYLLNETADTSNPLWRSVVNVGPDGVMQTNNVKERGSLNELVLTLGGNYMERLLLGVTVGIPIINYDRKKDFTEDDLSGNVNDSFQSFTYNEDLQTTGAGVNLKLGAIFIPTDLFRIGIALHTPTYLSLHDVTNVSLTANTGNYAGTYTVPAGERQYDYSLITPWRGVVSLTGLMGKYGFISADYEYVSYRSARFKFNTADRDYEKSVNNSIEKMYKDASNIRLGIELRLANFGLRGGFGFYSNPYNDRTYKDGQRMSVSGGIGYRFSSGSFIDLGFVHHWYKNPEQPYTLSYTNVGEVPTATISTAQNNAVLTLGWKF